MRRRSDALIFALCGAVALAILAALMQKPGKAAKAAPFENSETTPEAATHFESMSPQERASLKAALQTLVEGLKGVGLKPVPKIEPVLAEAVASGDYIRILQAFDDAIYGRFVDLRESIPALKGYLDSDDSVVRCLAAEHLLVAGEREGVEKLIGLLTQQDPIPFRDPPHRSDLRDKAAGLLGKFRIEESADALQDYYRRTGSGSAGGALTALGHRAQLADERYQPSVGEWYGRTHATEFIPNLAETFNRTKNPDIRTPAAWALARMTGGQVYVDYLIEAARPAMESSDRRIPAVLIPSRKALRYLGSIQSPEAIAALEQALQSADPLAANDALVNLLFNQKIPSEPARRMLLEQLAGTADHRIPAENVMRIIAAMDDPELRQAAERASRRTSAYAWQYWGVQRSNWPVENWIYDHVVVLNPK
jgi:HEAT repeat protein